MTLADDKMYNLTGFDIEDFSYLTRTSYKFIFFDMVSKLRKNILKLENLKTVQIFKMYGEFEKFLDEPNPELIDFKVKRIKTYTTIWGLIAEKLYDECNEYGIPQLAYLFLKRKAYETLAKLKLHSDKIRHDFNEIVDFFVRMNKTRIKKNGKNIDFFIKIFKKNKKKIIFDETKKKIDLINILTKKASIKNKPLSSTSLIELSHFKSQNTKLSSSGKLSSTNFLPISEKEPIKLNIPKIKNNKQISSLKIRDFSEDNKLNIVSQKSITLKNVIFSDNRVSSKEKNQLKSSAKKDTTLKVTQNSFKSNFANIFKLREENSNENKLKKEMGFFRDMINKVKMTKSVEELKENIKIFQEKKKTETEKHAFKSLKSNNKLNIMLYPASTRNQDQKKNLICENSSTTLISADFDKKQTTKESNKEMTNSMKKQDIKMRCQSAKDLNFIKSLNSKSNFQKNRFLSDFKRNLIQSENKHLIYQELQNKIDNIITKSPLIMKDIIKDTNSLQNSKDNKSFSSSKSKEDYIYKNSSKKSSQNIYLIKDKKNDDYLLNIKDNFEIKLDDCDKLIKYRLFSPISSNFRISDCFQRLQNKKNESNEKNIHGNFKNQNYLSNINFDTNNNIFPIFNPNPLSHVYKMNKKLMKSNINLPYSSYGLFEKINISFKEKKNLNNYSTENIIQSNVNNNFTYQNINEKIKFANNVFQTEDLNLRQKSNKPSSLNKINDIIHSKIKSSNFINHLVNSQIIGTNNFSQTIKSHKFFSK